MATTSLLAAPPTDLPRLTGITIDGDAADWGDHGFYVGLPSLDGRIRPATRFDPRLRLAWDERGLLVLATVRDTSPTEAKVMEDAWVHDSLQILLRPANPDEFGYNVLISPGYAPEQPEPRVLATWEGKAPESRQAELAVTMARKLLPEGYQLEVLLPWANLQHAPQAGELLGLQVIINDGDGVEAHRLGSRFAAQLRDGGVRLAEHASAPILVAAQASYPDLRELAVEVNAVAELVGQKVTVMANAKPLVSATLTTGEDGRAYARLTAPMPPPGQSHGPLSVQAGPAAPVKLAVATADEARAFALLGIEPGFSRFVFYDKAFPAPRFDQADLARRLLGNYKLTTRYFNAAAEEVATADTPGRYGAVVTVTPEQGRPWRRYYTLLRATQPQYALRFMPAEVGRLELPEALVPGSLSGPALRIWLREEGTNKLAESQTGVRLLAGEYDATKHPDTEFDNAYTRDRAYWLNLQRKLYDLGPAPRVLPPVTTRDSARTLHAGSEAEAGFKPGTVDKLDGILREWTAANNVPCSVLVARHGVVILHQAYGRLPDGKPMTLDTPRWVASVTKLFSGSLTMNLVDQGIVDLETPIAQYLPPLRGVESSKPITLRILSTHTAGTVGSWGEKQPDMAERFVQVMPYLAVGEKQLYHGTSLNLAGHLLELSTGKPLPQLFRDQLFQPLGLQHSWVVDMGGSAVTTSGDLGKLAQLACNRGAYGRVRLYSEANWEKMLPRRLTDIMGPDATVSWGIGATPQERELFGPRVFGHGSASESILRIDPDLELVVVLVKSEIGAQNSKYKPLFLKAVSEGLVR